MIGQLCDDNCPALFNKEKVFTFQQNRLILKGKRNHSNGMWTVPVPIQPISHSSPTKSKNNNLLQHISGNSNLKLHLKRLFHKIKKSQVANTSNNKKYRNIPKATAQLKYLLQHVHNIKVISEQVNYIYAACFSPAKSTFLNAIKQGYFSSFPNLTTTNVEKYLTPSISSAKGHLDQQYQGSRSTSTPQELSNNPLDNLQEDLPALIDDEQITLPLSPSERTNLVFVTIWDGKPLSPFKSTIATDQTGRFPIKSKR